jgi:hypothetical protein
MGLNNAVLSALGQVGKLFYDTMVGKLISGNYPPGSDNVRGFSTIPDATRVESPAHENGRYVVKIIIDLLKAPFARAYEYGSGEHGPDKESYEIVPKKLGGEMVFSQEDWPRWEYLEGEGAQPYKGFFFLTHVNHPGVEAKPYIRPTIKQIDVDVKTLLAREFKVEFLKGGKPVEVIK